MNTLCVLVVDSILEELSVHGSDYDGKVKAADCLGMPVHRLQENLRAARESGVVIREPAGSYRRVYAPPTESASNTEHARRARMIEIVLLAQEASPKDLSALEAEFKAQTNNH